MSQSEFAGIIGVSPETIGSIEIGRIRLTEKMMRKIRAATGAEFRSRGGFKFSTNPQPPSKLDEVKSDPKGGVYFGNQDEPSFPPYAKEHFIEHRKRFGYDKSGPDTILNDITPSLRLLFRAAAKNDGKVRHRLPALTRALWDWMEDANANFNLRVTFPLE